MKFQLNADWEQSQCCVRTEAGYASNVIGLRGGYGHNDRGGKTEVEIDGGS